MKIKFISSFLGVFLLISDVFGQQNLPNSPVITSNPIPNNTNQIPYFVYYIPKAPDMMGPGFYYTNCYGTTYGPNYYVVPPFAPVNGPLPVPSFCNGVGCMGQAGGMGQNSKAFPGMSFPSHPFARSPRDYFMVD